MSNPSFSAGHAVLRKLALRTTCSTAGLSKMAVWGFLAGGGFFVFLGMAIDALWVQHSSPGPGSLVAWAAYVCIVAFFLFHSRGPVVIVGTPYFRTRRFDRSVLAVHGLSMLAMLMWSIKG